MFFAQSGWNCKAWKTSAFRPSWCVFPRKIIENENLKQLCWWIIKKNRAQVIQVRWRLHCNWWSTKGNSEMSWKTDGDDVGELFGLNIRVGWTCNRVLYKLSELWFLQHFLLYCHVYTKYLEFDCQGQSTSILYTNIIFLEDGRRRLGKHLVMILAVY